MPVPPRPSRPTPSSQPLQPLQPSPSSQAVDPATLRALSRGRATTRELAQQLLTHVPDIGDLPTQRLLDAWVEQAADTLLALSDALEERLLDAARPPDAATAIPVATTGHHRAVRP